MKEDTQWDLLVRADDIKRGDLIEVDCDGETQEMTYLSHTSRVISLVDSSKKPRKFSTEDLESLDPDYVALIVGKST
jgi:hypothetical protein